MKKCIGCFYLLTSVGYITGNSGYLDVDSDYLDFSEMIAFSTIDEAITFAKMHLRMCEGRCGDIEIVTFDKNYDQHWLCTIYD